MLGWFSAFRQHGAPTHYGENRTPVLLDSLVVGVACAVALPTLAFLLILPGLRRARLSSSLSLAGSMGVGAQLLLALSHPSWHVAVSPVLCPYKSFSSHLLPATLSVNVGLQSVNVSLTTPHPHPLSYNEKFDISEGICPSPSPHSSSPVQWELHRGLVNGLPYPILKVLEYFSVQREAFVWGRMYRAAGYYSSVLLWLAVCTWSLSVVLLCVCPWQFGPWLFFTGLLQWSAALVFSSSVPSSMDIRFPSGGVALPLVFHFGPSFYATLISGGLCVGTSTGLWLAHWVSGYSLDTVFTARRQLVRSSSRESTPSP